MYLFIYLFMYLFIYLFIVSFLKGGEELVQRISSDKAYIFPS